MRKNATGTDNQQGSPPRVFQNISNDPSETIRRPPTSEEIKAYFQGAAHDGTYNSYNHRARISQKGNAWLCVLKYLLERIGISSWIYKEGKDRDIYVLETQAKFIDFAFNPKKLETLKEKISYIRGFFDAEGGIPKNIQNRFYIQLVQKDRSKLRKLKNILQELGIETGIIHNPSRSIDPFYWRMFVRAQSYKTFISNIGSWHPKKYQLLKKRWMKI